MATPGKPHPVMPVVGAIYADARVAAEALGALRVRLGAPVLASPVCPFDLTDHYQAEMGDGLSRVFHCFALADPGLLAEWKHAAIDIEAAQARQDGRRVVNLDPGYLDGSKLVLASTSSLGHRVYIGKGIYAEATMTYRGGAWVKRDYTFPDFASGRYDEFMKQARESYLQLTAMRPGPVPDAPDQ